MELPVLLNIPEGAWVMVTLMAEGIVFFLMFLLRHRIPADIKPRVVLFCASLIGFVTYTISGVGIGLAVFYAVRSSSNFHSLTTKKKEIENDQDNI